MTKIKAYIEIFKSGKSKFQPTMIMKKPFKREIKCAKDFGYETYECTITYNNKKPL